LTGGGKAEENRAKQKDEGAPMVARAKNEQRGAKRYNDPVLAVTVASATFQTINWSISGMLLSECVHPAIEAGQEHQISVFAPQRPPITIPIRIIRVDSEKRCTSLTFFEDSPAEVWAFFKKLIMTKQASTASV
jgi:hypothetical protein